MDNKEKTLKFEEELKQAFERGKQYITLDPLNNYEQTDKNTNLGFINHKTQDSYFKCYITRGEGIFPVNISTLLETIQHIDTIKKMEKRFKESKLIANTPSGFGIAYTLFSPPIGDDREDIGIGGVIEENGQKYFVMTSIDHPDYSLPEKGRVRCRHYFLIYSLQPLEENKTNVVFISCFDPMGSIPEFVKNIMNNSRGIEVLEQLYGIFDQK